MPPPLPRINRKREKPDYFAHERPVARSHNARSMDIIQRFLSNANNDQDGAGIISFPCRPVSMNASNALMKREEKSSSMVVFLCDDFRLVNVPWPHPTTVVCGVCSGPRCVFSGVGGQAQAMVAWLIAAVARVLFSLWLSKASRMSCNLSTWSCKVVNHYAMMATPISLPGMLSAQR